MKRIRLGLTALALLASLPFFVLITAGFLGRLLGGDAFRPVPRLQALFTAIFLFVPYLNAAQVLSQTGRYLAFSRAAVLLGLAALIWLIAAERRRALCRARFWFLLSALASVVGAPFLFRYRPAVDAAPGWVLRLVEAPGLEEGFVRACQAAAEVRGCQYEPLGWADAETLVYRRWCGGRFQTDLANVRSEWDPGVPGTPLAYSVGTGRIVPFEGNLGALRRQTCSPNRCVTPGLVVQAGFPPPGYFSGQFGEPLLSPDGRRVAFTARHVYGPEDLLILESEAPHGESGGEP